MVQVPTVQRWTQVDAIECAPLKQASDETGAPPGGPSRVFQVRRISKPVRVPVLVLKLSVSRPSRCSMLTKRLHKGGG